GANVRGPSVVGSSLKVSMIATTLAGSSVPAFVTALAHSSKKAYTGKPYWVDGRELNLALYFSISDLTSGRGSSPKIDTATGIKKLGSPGPELSQEVPSIEPELSTGKLIPAARICRI